MLLIFLVVTLSIALLIRLFQKHTYWSKRNVKQAFPIPIFGDNLLTIFGSESFGDMLKRFYFSYSGFRYCGIYHMTKPTLMIRDPNLIKQIAIKDFDYFTDHREFLPDDNEPLWSKNLFALRGDKWRNMRSTLSPSFSSAKMRSMFYLMNECAEEYTNFYTQLGDKIELEMKESFKRYANDVIATCAFGLKCNSLKERENDFFMMGQEATDFTPIWKTVKFLLFLLAPTVSKVLGLSLFPDKIRKFFTNIVKDTIKIREEQHIIRPDMLQLMMEARKSPGKSGTLQEITDIDIIAQAMIFFFAGFDSVSSLMSFASYEMAINPNIQEKLRLEVDEVFAECKGKLTYEHLAGMKYMDMVLAETLRKWPNAYATDRTCVKPYTIQPKKHGESAVHLNVGDSVWFPISGILHDPEYYPEPECFDPERFRDDNNSNLNGKETYFPFGIGPRIWSRFAFVETKTVLFHILSKFEIVAVEKTAVPKLSKKNFTITQENPNWLALVKRTYCGIYQMTKPTLMIRDPNLIKQIAIKDFDYFTDHREFLPYDNEPLWSKNLFALRGDKWRNMRSILSPSFSSAKMRSMFYLMNECAEQYTNFYMQLGDKIELEMKESFKRYANDVIATCAFGLKCNSLKERENDFFMMGQEATDFTPIWKTVKFLLFLLAPTVSKVLGLSLFPDKIRKFFTNIVKDTIKIREEQHIIRPDMLHLMMEARKSPGKSGNLQEITDIDIIAQAMIFFFAGFDSVSSLMSFASYEMAINPNIQEKLRLEVDEVFAECKGKLTYEHLAGMKYMDMVLAETLRKWPNADATDRTCVKPYTIQPKKHGESAVHLNVGDSVWFPISGILHDPEYYPEPERFDPERFRDDNNRNLNGKETYFPFGIGPRNCIGSRFAFVETKTVLFHILSKFEIVAVEKTAVPKLSKKNFTITQENPNWLALVKRTYE